MNVQKPSTISVFGLGKLGSPLAVAFAHKGFEVIGVDVNEQYVESLNRGIAPVEETGLQDMLDTVRGRIRATTQCEEAVLSSQVSSIIVPTPTNPDGVFALDFVMAAIQDIGRTLRQVDRYHLVAIVSTVMPGDTDKLRAVLEAASGKVCGRDFGMCYSPEFIALGSVLHDLLNPDMLLIGQSDDAAGDLYEEVLLQLVDHKPQVRRMNFVNAELTKLAVNSYVTTKITYANMIARLCERLPDADAHVVTTALGMDSRIGSKYLIGAVAYGGPCFPRDNIALTKVAERLGTEAPLAEATDRFNRKQSHMLAELVRQFVQPGGHVVVLGLSYKPETAVVEESASLYLIRDLLEMGCKVSGYDPAGMDNAKRVFGSMVGFPETLDDAVKSGDVIVVATAWKAFRDLNPDSLRRPAASPTIIDCWRILDAERYTDIAQVVHLGKGYSFEEAAALGTNTRRAAL